MANTYGRRRQRFRREINPSSLTNETLNPNRSLGQRLATFKFVPDINLEQALNLNQTRPLFLGACALCTVKMITRISVYKKRSKNVSSCDFVFLSIFCTVVAYF